MPWRVLKSDTKRRERGAAVKEDGSEEMLEELLAMSRVMVNILAGSLVRADVPGISAPQFRILDMVYNGVDKPADCARMLDVTPPAVTSIIDKLVDKGFVERKSEPQDRRRVVLSLTPAGRRAVRRVNDRRAEVLNGILDNMRPADVQKFEISIRAFLEGYDRLSRGELA